MTTVRVVSARGGWEAIVVVPLHKGGAAVVERRLRERGASVTRERSVVTVDADASSIRR